MKKSLSQYVMYFWKWIKISWFKGIYDFFLNLFSEFSKAQEEFASSLRNFYFNTTKEREKDKILIGKFSSLIIHSCTLKNNNIL